MTVEIYPAFSVPFGQRQHPDALPFNRQLRQLLLAREAEGTRYANPNPSLKLQRGVFESEFELFSWPEPCVQELKRFCWESLGQIIAELNGYSPREMTGLQIFSHTWYHVTRKGGFTIPHTHPMASWSGVYCVDPGTTPPEYPESGVLRFHNPHHYSNYFMDAGNARLRAPYHHGTWSIRFQPGQLLLFPSWVQHEVLPFFGEDERITVAFNCWFGAKDS